MKNNRRAVGRVIGALAMAFGGALMLGALDATAGEADKVAPSPLLAIDQNRQTVIERVVSDWGSPLEQSNAGITGAQLRTMLEGLRADHLLAASLAGSVSGLRDVLASATVSTAPASGVKVAAKNLGDASADLLYTPTAPCRLFDSRVSQGGLGTPALTVRRTYGATAPVSNQGGPGGCVAGPGSVVALIQIGTLAPSGSGLLQGGPQGAASFPNALVLYQTGDQYGTAGAMPLNAANGQFDLVELFATADLYGDLLGFFKPASGFVASVAAGTGITVTGSSTPTVAVAGSFQMPQNCTNGQIPKSSGGGVWTCAADNNSGGTVASVATGAGLSGGPITGSGTINLASSQLLPTTACANGQVPQWNGNAWGCASAGGPGTVTSVASGTGLTGGPISTTGTLSADTTYLQRRVSGNCPAGSNVQAVAADGTVTCQSLTTNATTAVTISGNITGGQITGAIAGSQITGAITTATVPGAQVTGAIAGSQLTGAITTATVPGAQVTGAIAGSQLTGAITFPDGTQSMAVANCGAEGDVAVVHSGKWVCRSALPHYVDNGDGTVTDNQTGLMWEKKLASTDALCTGGTPNVRCQQNTYTWSAASPNPDGTLYTAFLQQLNDLISPNGGSPTPCFANHCDWRIPTIGELRSIAIAYDGVSGCGVTPPCIDSIFGPTQASNYWSSTPLASNPGNAWFVLFGNGGISNFSEANSNFARAVRGGR